MDAQARVIENSALFEGNVRARHAGHRLPVRVGDETAHPHGFVGASFNFPVFVLAQLLVPPHVAEPVYGSNRRGNEVARRHVPSPFLSLAVFLGAVIVYHVGASRVRLVAATDTLDYCLSGDVAQER